MPKAWGFKELADLLLVIPSVSPLVAVTVLTLNEERREGGGWRGGV